MNANQALSYLAAVNEIPTREMSKAMFRFLRSAARCANREYPGMAGYYDPEYEGPRALPSRFVCFPASISATIPQSRKLQDALSAKFPVVDPFSNSLALILG